ncbi:MAG TPA: carboxypeptidase regulatory-like domain-containing protein, partial [bacterium]|nr:carboxypeptidase regulatory-like domain-containing protein [bacterium]
GGGGGGTTAYVPAYGSIDGYVYATIGSESSLRVSEAAPAGYKAVQGATTRATCGSTVKSTTTNQSGYFKVSTLPAGTCTVRIEKSGYAAKQYQVTVSANKTSTVGGSGGATISPSDSGFIRVEANISGGEIVLDGEETALTIPATLSRTLNDICAGEHAVTLVQPGFGDVGDRSVTVTEGQTAVVEFELNPAGNDRPVADAGADGKTFAATYYTYEQVAGDIIASYTFHQNSYTLDGTGSSDPDGDDITYRWEQVSGPESSLSSTTGQKPVFVPAEEGSYVFKLTVKDGYLESEPDYVTVYAAHPEGRIAYYAMGNGDEDIFILNADGTDLRLLTINTTLDRDPCWSPDGTKILYGCNPTGTMRNMCEINVDGTGYVKVPIDYAYPGDYSPDGDEIVFTCYVNNYDEVCRMNSDYTDITQLTNMRLSNGTMFAKYSYDGSSILFIADLTVQNSEVYRMDADGSNQQNLTNSLLTEMYASWTPGGKILYTEGVSLSDNFKLREMNSDGTEKHDRPVPEGVNNVETPVMSGDERFIYYVDMSYVLHVMYADGSAEMSYGLYARKLDYHPGP